VKVLVRVPTEASPTTWNVIEPIISLASVHGASLRS
jgi:hypothetical protein